MYRLGPSRRPTPGTVLPPSSSRGCTTRISSWYDPCASSIDEEGGLDLEEASQSLDMLKGQSPLPSQQIRDRRDGEARTGRDVASRDLTGLHQARSMSALDAGGIGSCSSSYFSTKTANASKHSVSSGVRSCAAIAEAVERVDRQVVFLLVAYHAQGAESDTVRDTDHSREPFRFLAPGPAAPAGSPLFLAFVAMSSLSARCSRPLDSPGALIVFLVS